MKEEGATRFLGPGKRGRPVSPEWRSRPQEKRNPQGSPWGKRKAVFWVCRVKTVGPTVGGIPILDAWRCGLRRRIGPSPAEGRLEADLDALRNEGHDHRVSRFGSLLAGTQESAHQRLEHLFIRPEVPGVEFGPSRNPSALQTMWAKHSAYARPARQASLQFSTQKGYGF
jgi:hypothetical protein